MKHLLLISKEEVATLVSYTQLVVPRCSIYMITSIPTTIIEFTLKWRNLVFSFYPIPPTLKRKREREREREL